MKFYKVMYRIFDAFDLRVDVFASDIMDASNKARAYHASNRENLEKFLAVANDIDRSHLFEVLRIEIK